MIYNFVRNSSSIVSKEHRILSNVKESCDLSYGTIFGFVWVN